MNSEKSKSIKFAYLALFALAVAGCESCPSSSTQPTGMQVGMTNQAQAAPTASNEPARFGLGGGS